MDQDSEKEEITLHVYDLRQRLSATSSCQNVAQTAIVNGTLNGGKYPLDNDGGGIWYAGIVAYGKEYAFSQAGVESTQPVSVSANVSWPYVSTLNYAFKVFVHNIMCWVRFGVSYNLIF